MAEEKKLTLGKVIRFGVVLLIVVIASYLKVGEENSATENGGMGSNFVSQEVKQEETIAKKGDTAGSATAGEKENRKEEVRPIPMGAAHGEGRVVRILRDDEEGIRHQKFIIRLSNGETLMIVHNIDLAPRIEGILVGDVVEYCGEFVDNDQGGLIHWTHRDPNHRHASGWIKHNGKIYE